MRPAYAITALVLCVAASGRAEDDISPVRSKLALVESFGARARTEIAIKYSTSVRKVMPAAQHYENRYEIRLAGATEDPLIRYLRLGTPSLLAVRRDHAVYCATEEGGGRWSSFTEADNFDRFKIFDPILWYERPIDGQPVHMALERYGIAIARRDEAGMRVLIPLLSTLREAASAGTPISGIVGWWCDFQRSEHDWRLSSVELLGTVPGGRGSVPGGPAYKFVPESEVRRVLDAYDARPVSRVEYGGFVVLGRREVPTNCALTDGSGRIESSIDPTSIAELGPDERGFEFEVPASFGITGQHVDLRTGASSLVREAGVSPSDIVDRAAARSESLGEAIARERPTDWILIGAVVLGGVAAVVVAVRAARTSTRRRA